MKNLFLVLFSVSVLCTGCSSDSGEKNDTPEDELQVTLYDENKEAVAYIDYADEGTIYLFGGKPVAYIELEEQVYGFDGRFLGWYFDGVLYEDQTHNAVGAKHGVVKGGINTAVTHAEKAKGIKQVKPVRSVKGDASYIRPVLNDRWSGTLLADFFAGRENEGLQ